MRERPNSADTRPVVALIEDPASAYPLEETFADAFELVKLPPSGCAGADKDGRVRALVTTTNAGADAGTIDAFPALELVAVAGGHVDRIDRARLAERRLPLCATPGLSAADVADFTMGLMLAGLRGLCAGDRLVQAARWGTEQPGLWRSLSGLRLGILGLGRIGRILAERAEGFGMTVRYTGPRQKPDVPWPFIENLITLAAVSDVLAVTCASGPLTRRIVDAPVLDALGPTGFLVAISRGALDEEALIAALGRQALAGAALDTLEEEPRVPPALLSDPRVIVTPHMASKTRQMKTAAAELVHANLLAHFAGRPLLSPVR